jgi:hypothetical protein
MAVMQAVHPRVSYADMERWPEDGRRYELYDGEVFEIPSPLPIHQMVLARLYLALQGHVSAHGGIVLFAPLDIVLTTTTWCNPIWDVTRERQHQIDPKKVTRKRPIWPWRFCLRGPKRTIAAGNYGCSRPTASASTGS